MAYKIYPGAGAVALPRDLTLPAVPTFAALAGNVPPNPDTSLDMANLTRILFCADGLTRRRRVSGQGYPFRAPAAAGAPPSRRAFSSRRRARGARAGLLPSFPPRPEL